jgi:hypothetical protein
LTLSIKPDVISIDGEARSYADADFIAGSLGKSGTYEVTSPLTRALRDRGVSFKIVAKPASSKRGEQ